MNRKSAFAAAGGVAASLIAGVGAVSHSGTVGASPASPSPTPHRVKPIIKRRTIVVHKTRKTAPSKTAPVTVAPQQVAAVSPPTYTQPPPTTSSGGSATGGGESESDNGGEGGD